MPFYAPSAELVVLWMVLGAALALGVLLAFWAVVTVSWLVRRMRPGAVALRTGFHLTPLAIGLLAFAVSRSPGTGLVALLGCALTLVDGLVYGCVHLWRATSARRARLGGFLGSALLAMIAGLVAVRMAFAGTGDQLVFQRVTVPSFLAAFVVVWLAVATLRKQPLRRAIAEGTLGLVGALSLVVPAALLARDAIGESFRARGVARAGRALADQRQSSSEDVRSYVSRQRAAGQPIQLVEQFGRAWQGLDLAGLDLRGMLLDGVDLNGSILRETDLRNASMVGASVSGDARVRPVTQLQGVRLAGANLSHALLSDADLKEVDLTGADLRGALLQGSDMRRTILATAQLRGALFPRAKMPALDLLDHDLTDTSFWNTDLTGARLDDCVLERASMRSVRLRGASLRSAQLRGANLLSADLRDADLADADLRGVMLANADLRGAHLEGTDLTGSYLAGAKIDGVTGLDAESFAALAERTKESRARRFQAQVRGYVEEARRAGVTPDLRGRFGRYLVGINFSGLDLHGVDLGEVVLLGSAFVDTDLSNATLRGAVLRHAALEGTKLDGADLTDADLSESVIAKITTVGARMDGTHLYCSSLAGQVPEAREDARLPVACTRHWPLSSFSLVGASG